MTRLVARTLASPLRLPLLDMPRAMIVIGCALSLILAGKPLPY
ncbi:MAG: hypothetical protein ABIW31_06550 [Novosphingobium sp.]